jgi:hypothetical protein
VAAGQQGCGAATGLSGEHGLGCKVNKAAKIKKKTKVKQNKNKQK